MLSDGTRNPLSIGVNGEEKPCNLINMQSDTDFMSPQGHTFKDRIASAKEVQRPFGHNGQYANQHKSQMMIHQFGNNL